MSLRFLLLAVAGIAILAAVVVADAQPRRVQVGTLSCSVSAGIGLIVASQRNVNCNFQPDNGPPEAYTGTMTIVGVDVGFTTGSAIVWSVFTDTNRFAGMLTGTYVGATAQATALSRESGLARSSGGLTIRWHSSRFQSRARSDSTLRVVSAR